jgi:hypothetical protein
LLDELHRRAGTTPAVPARAMAEFILAFGAGLALERAADPASLPWAALVQLMSGAVGIDDVDSSAVSALEALR